MTCGGESPTLRCIPSRYFCDGDNDCGNGWDESDEVCGELFYVFVHGSICITHRLNFLGGGTLDVGSEKVGASNNGRTLCNIIASIVEQTSDAVGSEIVHAFERQSLRTVCYH